MEKIHKDINFIKETDITKQMQKQIENQSLKIIKVDENMCGRIAEVNNRLTSFIAKNRTPASSDPSGYDINRIQSLIGANIQNAIAKIETTLQQFKNQRQITDKPPLINSQGNQILYTTNKNGNLSGLINPDLIKASCDGSLSLRPPESNQPKTSQRKMNTSNNKQQKMTNFKATDTDRNNHNKFQSFNAVRKQHKNSYKNNPSNYPTKGMEHFEEDYIPLITNEESYHPNITHNKYHSFQQPPQTFQICKFGSNCWNRDCNKKHPHVSRRNEEVLAGLGFLERIFRNTQRDWHTYGEHQRRIPGVQVGPGGKLNFY